MEWVVIPLATRWLTTSNRVAKGGMWKIFCLRFAPPCWVLALSFLGGPLSGCKVEWLAWMYEFMDSCVVVLDVWLNGCVVGRVSSLTLNLRSYRLLRACPYPRLALVLVAG
jgi:hypothetical protein